VRPLLQQYVTAQAERRPEATALVMDGRRLSYGELEATSNRLAHLLHEAGCRRGDRVCLLMPKCREAIVAMLGVLKVGAMYVPLDPDSPTPRLAKMVTSADNRWFLAGGPVTQQLDALFQPDGFAARHAVGWLSAEPCGAALPPAFHWADLAGYPADLPEQASSPADGAHILFTSGSTGVPKGVVVKHESVVHFVEWAVGYFGTRPDDQISCHPPLHFDLSTFDLFASFCAGATVHLVPPALSLVPQRLAAFIRTSQLTQWFSVPSVLSYLASFDAVRHGDFPTLRRVLWCGEVLPTPALTYWMRRVPHATFTNLYGPTEATIASSFYTVPRPPEDERAAIPIGTACPGEEILILDDAMRPVPSGEPGDLYIRGVGLSPGYWRDPDKTAGAFLPNPLNHDPTDRLYRTGDLARVGADGLIYFLGRADTQIKSRGYRIELGEIEAALGALGVLREYAIVAVDAGTFGGPIICCAYVPDPDSPVEAARLRSALAQLVPAYMLPARWKAYDELPRNPNGKIDRPCLREAFAAQTAAPEPAR
jgi:amino acid adenylation domain-containing protein